MMTGTLVASTIINAIFMVALMYLAVEKKQHDRRILHLILLSSAICAISLFSMGVQLWPG